MTRKVVATKLLVDLLTEYDQARKAAAAWKAQTDNLKDSIIEVLGYDPEDAKPEPTEVHTAAGDEVFKVNVGTWRGLNQKYLKEHHPDVYAECEASKATLKITYPAFNYR